MVLGYTTTIFIGDIVHACLLTLYWCM